MERLWVMLAHAQGTNLNASRLAASLGVSNVSVGRYIDLLGHPVAGNSWEGFVIENILSVLPQGVQAFYYRTSGGAEIDLVLEYSGSPRKLYAIEIKRSPAAGVQRGFHEACADIKPTHKFVIHAQNDVFPMKDDIQATGLHAFMELTA